MKSRLRRVITGDDKKMIRHYLLDQRKKPKNVLLLDKISFSAGVLNITIIEFFLFNRPYLFWLYYSLIIFISMTIRLSYFNSLGYQYYLLDFCYFTVLSTYIQIYLFPSYVQLFKVIFIFSCGPLLGAIILWRTSLVFHDYDKITSVLIHILPTMMCYCYRHYGNYSIMLHRRIVLEQTDVLTLYDIKIAIGIYIFWQIIYLIKTELIDKEKLDTHPNLMTSLRYMSTSRSNTTSRFILKLLRKINIFGENEEYARNIKTKLVFTSCQFMFTLTTFIPAIWLYSNQNLHLSLIILIFAIAVYNGASFYIEIFSKRYINQFK